MFVWFLQLNITLTLNTAAISRGWRRSTLTEGESRVEREWTLGLATKKLQELR